MRFNIFLLILLSIFPLLSLATPGIMSAHDAPDHVARIANFYQSLSEGVIVPRWAGNLNWGYGHPILMFLYPLPSYVASVFHSIGVSFVDSTKLVFAAAYIASIVTFYLWAKAQWNPAAGFIGALLYGFAPYRFVDLYVRGAIGEHVAFVFPPIIFWGLLLLARQASRMSLTIIATGVAGLLLSHNAISLMIVPIVVLYVAYLWAFEAKMSWKFLLFSIWSIGLGFLASSFFWLPAFIEGKYTLRDIVTKGEFSDRFVSFISFFHSPWNYGGGSELSKEVGIVHWIGVATSLFVLIKQKKHKDKWLAIGSIAVFFASLVLMTAHTQIVWRSVTILQKFQFPWRFLTVAVLTSSMIGAWSFSKLPFKRPVAVYAAVLVFLLGSTYHMWRPKDYIQRQESYYSGIYESTTDTGESSPIWSVRFMEHRPAAPFELETGSAEVIQSGRTSTSRLYDIKTKQRIRFIEHTLYFPGWAVYVDGNKISPEGIEYQDPQYRGLITFWVEQGNHTLQIRFEDTKLRRWANLLSLAGLALLVITATIQIWVRKLSISR